MVMFTNDTYEKEMYERILAHANCTIVESGPPTWGYEQYVGAIEITNYSNGENVAIECTKCNEVIIDFNRPGEEN